MRSLLASHAQRIEYGWCGLTDRERPASVPQGSVIGGIALIVFGAAARCWSGLAMATQTATMANGVP